MEMLLVVLLILMIWLICLFGVRLIGLVLYWVDSWECWVVIVMVWLLELMLRLVIVLIRIVIVLRVKMDLICLGVIGWLLVVGRRVINS